MLYRYKINSSMITPICRADSPRYGQLGKPHKTCLYVEMQEYQWPIVYSLDYNVSLCGFERLQSYDIVKGKNIFIYLKDVGLLDDVVIVRPNEAQREDLLVVHSKAYLDNLRWGNSVSGLADLPRVGLLPNFLVESKIMRPLRYQTGGTILALKLALERGWSINLGGGFHHCSANRGGGFCAYADISLAVRLILNHMSELTKVMIIDLDASQGNGPERDFLDDDRVYIFDMFNRQIYPQDGFAKRGIRRKIELQVNTSDEEYLQLLRSNLDEALTEFSPDLVVYIAGASVLSTDPIGLLSLTIQGVIERDQIVIQKMRTRGIPVAMVTGGGYGKDAAKVMAQSILNLYNLGLISGPLSGSRPAVIARHPSLVPQRGSGSHVDEGSMWSRFRSISVTNFAYLTAAMAAPALTNKTPIQDGAEVIVDNSQLQHDDTEDDDFDSELVARNELSRCFSLPNIEGYEPSVERKDCDSTLACHFGSGDKEEM